MADITIIIGARKIEFFHVPFAVKNAIVALLNEMEKSYDGICSAESEI